MASKALPSPEVLRQLLRYEPETGKLFWRERGPEWFSTYRACRAWNGRYAETEAFTSEDRNGYRQGNLLNHVYRAHRIIWAMQTGQWPNQEIDHRNTLRNDNSWDNLREAGRGQNVSNQRISRRNTSGTKGVSWCKRDSTWRAEIGVGGRTIVLGYFSDKEEAASAYAKASAQMHGDFGRVA